MNPIIRVAGIAALALFALNAKAALPEPASDKFCQEVQKFMANTEIEGTNTLFDNMPDYRSSKPSPDPLMIYQVVTYRGELPIMVSCKVKGAAQIRSVYGEDKAGEQLFCPAVVHQVQADAVAELEAEGNAEAAAKARAFVVDENEPFMTGRDYLADFELSYEGADGAVHFNAPGLFHDYDSWTTWILPEIVEGQVYCHLATVDYMKALATGEMTAPETVTTADDAPTQPAS